MRILVTGGAGFIGSHTCLLLLEKGFELFVIDSYINSCKASLERVYQLISGIKSSKVKNFHIYEGDLRDYDFLENIFLNAKSTGESIKGVIHFAGLKSVSESVKYPSRYWDSNVNSSINLIKIMELHDCRTIVFSSSATIYGLSGQKFISEDEKIEPINPYGSTKYAIEQLLKDTFYSQKNKWRIAILRYFNPIGAHPSGVIGENPLGTPNNLFPFITQVAAGRLEILNIFGNDWPTIDGTGIRDYIHVMDLAEGHIKAFEYLEKVDPTIEFLNLGTGKGTSVLELINTFESVNNLKVPHQFTGRREGDTARVVADNSYASSLLQWSPKRTLEDMCIDGWKWQSLNKAGFT